MSASSRPSFTIGVVAHEKRITEAKNLYDKVGADVLMVDDKQQHLGCDANHRRTWHALTTTQAEWLVVLEDDAQPIPGFRNQLQQALAVAPTHIISLYLGRQYPSHWQPAIARTTTEANQTHAHWITTDAAIHAVGLAIHTTLVPHMLQHQRTHLPIDQAITKWAQQHNHPIAYTWPSLINHADLPTLVRHPDGITRTQGRIAWQVGSRDQWNNSSVNMINPRTWTRKCRTA
jgi:GR25 family glycosyltransferase involved in LPS biosynthesis